MRVLQYRFWLNISPKIPEILKICSSILVCKLVKASSPRSPILSRIEATKIVDRLYKWKTWYPRLLPRVSVSNRTFYFCIRISERFTRWGAIQRVLFHKREKIRADHYRAPRSRVGPRRCSVSLPTPPLGKEQVPVARSTPPGCGARAFWSAPAPDLGEIPIGSWSGGGGSARSRSSKAIFSSKIKSFIKNKDYIRRWTRFKWKRNGPWHRFQFLIIRICNIRVLWLVLLERKPHRMNVTHKGCGT